MKRFTKYVIALLVLCMIISVVPAASAAGYTGEAGQTVDVSFKVDDIKGIDGDITVADPHGIVKSAKIAKIETGLNKLFDDDTFFCDGGAADSVEIIFQVTLKDDAETGATCTVEIEYEVTLNDDNCTLSDMMKKTETITVVAAATEPTEPEGPAATEDPKDPEDPAATEKPEDPEKPTEPKPTEPAVKIDYTKLQEQIDIALGLNKGDYTSESWAALEAVLAKAQAALNSGDQAAVDAAMQALADAIAALVPMDYSALEDAMAKVETFLGDSTVAGKLQELLDALKASKELLTSGDQKAVDEAAALLEQLLGELEKAIKDLEKIEEIITEIEKIVEVEPTDPYCNIQIHYVWPILFFISLFVNVGFIALVVIYFVRRKKNQTDDTPLVDYDIGEDAAE